MLQHDHLHLLCIGLMREHTKTSIELMGLFEVLEV